MKRNLNIVNNSENTCFSIHAKHNINCKKQSCKQWINNCESNNCVIIGANQGQHTLQKIGQIFDVSRMRICQIEQEIINKLKESLNL